MTAFSRRAVLKQLDLGSAGLALSGGVIRGHPSPILVNGVPVEIVVASFRAYGRTWHLRLPWGWNTGELGHEELRGYTGGAGHPDPSELRNASVEPIVRSTSSCAIS